MKSQKNHDDTQSTGNSSKFTQWESVKKTQIHRGPPKALKGRKWAQPKPQEYSHPEVQKLPHTPYVFFLFTHLSRQTSQERRSLLCVCLYFINSPCTNVFNTPLHILEIFSITGWVFTLPLSLSRAHTRANTCCLCVHHCLTGSASFPQPEKVNQARTLVLHMSE